MTAPTTAAPDIPLPEQGRRLFQDSIDWVANHSVEIAVALAAGTAIALVLIGLRAFGHRLIRDTSDDVRWRAIVGRALSKTSLFFIIMCAAKLVSAPAATPETLQRLIDILFVIAAAFQAAVWGRELILGLIQHRVGDADEHSTLGSAIGIIRLLVTIALFAIAVILILDNLGVNVTGLVAGLGIGGIAIGLAAQGIFSDLFAALSIIFDKPFRRGDAVRFDQTTGTVEQIGLKTTRVRSLTGEEIVISNANLLNKQVQNFSNLEHRRIVLNIGVIYQTPPEVVEAIPDIVREIVGRHEEAELIRCGMIAFGASSLDFEIVFDVHTAAFDTTFRIRNDICVALLRTFNERDIEFAYPTTTNFTAAPDGKAVWPYPKVKMLAETDEDHH